MASTQKHQGQPQANEDDPEILDRGIGQETLEIILHQGIEHAHDGRHAADCQHADAPLPMELADEVKDHPNETVHSHLEHHPGHHGRYVRGRHGVGLRQPGMQRHQSCFHAEAEKDQNEGDTRPDEGELGDAHRIEAKATAKCRQDPEAKQNGQSADMGHQEVEKCRASVSPILVLERYQKIR